MFLAFTREIKVKMPRRWNNVLSPNESCLFFGSIETCRHDIVVWGNENIGPTSQGHAPAPNRKMQSLLAKHVLGVVGSEHRSSNLSACHHGTVVSIFNKRCPGRRHTCYQVFGLLHHAVSRRQRCLCHCGHLYCDEKMNIFTCVDHRYINRIVDQIFSNKYTIFSCYVC